jgi:hypothetical protein
LLIPVRKPKEIRSCFKLIESIVAPKGSVKFLALKNLDKDIQDKMAVFLPEVNERLKHQNISTSYTYVSGDDFSETVKVSMQSLNAAFFKPNTLFLSIVSNGELDDSFLKVIDEAEKNNYAVLLYIAYENIGLSLEKDIALWLKDFSPEWKLNFNLNNNDLAILISLLLQKNWKGNLSINMAFNSLEISNNEDISLLNDLVRFPVSSKISAYHIENELELLKKGSVDINIMGLPKNKSISDLINIVNLTKTSALFCLDSSSENALV